MAEVPPRTSQIQEPGDGVTPHVPEIALSWWWHTTRLTEPMVLTDGRQVSIVFRGRWSHGLGPDFQDAMLSFDRRTLVTGSIEIHRRSSEWRAHGHHLDPRYNDVVLHLVVENNDDKVRRSDGKTVPTLVIDPSVLEAIGTANRDLDWSTVGGATCAEAIARENPAPLVQILHHFGDERLHAKVGAMEASMLIRPPNQVLYGALMDALGYSANREPMAHLASILPISAIAQSTNTWDFCSPDVLVAALLLGTAGFLPLSPSLAEIIGFEPELVAEIEMAWSIAGTPWQDLRLAPASWTNLRVRPANHPLTRLVGAAHLFSTCGGVLPLLVETVLNDPDPVATLIEQARFGRSNRIGKGRASAIVTNVFIPWVLAIQQEADANAELHERASELWESLKVVEPNAISDRAHHQVAGKSACPVSAFAASRV